MSFFITPFVILNNLVEWLRNLPLKWHTREYMERLEALSNSSQAAGLDAATTSAEMADERPDFSAFRRTHTESTESGPIGERTGPVCAACGKRLNGSPKYCPYCGASLGV
jgi:hypothetical protein